MEPASLMRMLSQAENIFGNPLRKGQRDVIEGFFSGVQLTARSPTGLGKTRAAAGAYAVLRAKGDANRALYIVPRGKQADQAADEFPLDLGVFSGEKFQSLILGDTPIPAIRSHRLGCAKSL